MEGQKYDEGKLPWHLLPGDAVQEVVKVLDFGQKKYTVEFLSEWQRLLFVPIVKEIQLTTPSGNVVVVTKDHFVSPIPNMQNANVRIVGVGQAEIKKESVSWAKLTGKIQTLLKEKDDDNSLNVLSNSGLPKNTTTSCVQKDVQSARQKNTCILTIVTTQGNFEASFAPDATMDSAFWTTTWKDLNEHFDISKPLNRNGTRNWEKGMSWSRVFSALMRHMWSWYGGNARDPETGLSHLAHAGCCILFLLAYELRGAGDDDRPESNLL